jgi:alkanesulfonate monooxygenase SsuD/methylene tetrahydromethanopterin reductase-like flavin-dependent oxidoreductase (luciferase family)
MPLQPLIIHGTTQAETTAKIYESRSSPDRAARDRRRAARARLHLRLVGRVNGTDAFTPLILAAQWASELQLGTAIDPICTRGPGLLAMSGAILAGLAPGRFVLGTGASSQVW